MFFYYLILITFIFYLFQQFLIQGKIEAQGTFTELSNSKMDFTKLLAAADETTEKTAEKPSEEHIIDPRRTSVLSIANVSIVK